MNSVNATAPLNLISNIDVLDKCSVICEYKSNYPACRGTIKNKGSYLSIIMDQCNVDVTYNREKFALEEVRIYQPSLHAWDNKKADGEIIIIHKRKRINDKPDECFVCIPIKMGGAGNQWFSFMAMVPPFYENSEPVAKSINIPNWTLNTIIPQGNYYNYQATSPLNGHNGSVEIIVYSLDQAVICSLSDYNMLKASLPKEFNITPRQYDKDRVHKLYYHIDAKDDGPEYYLDCTKVDDGDDEQIKEEKVVVPGRAIKVVWEPILISGGILVFIGLTIWGWKKFHKSHS